MNIKLLVIGKTVKGFVSLGVEEYSKRLKHYVNFSIEVIQDIKNASSLSVLQLKEKESELILKHLSSEDTVVLLDEKGKEFSSKEFAAFIQQKMNQSTKSLVFVIGGAFGFDEKIKQTFNNKVSISHMTFSHQMIRLLFTEQLYRAFTILKNEPYHNE